MNARRCNFRTVLIGAVSVCLLAICLLQAGYGATLYRWVDGSGQVHFSDQQRAGASAYDTRHGNEADSMNAASAPASAASTPPAAHATADCNALRSQLASYEKASSVTEVDALGQSRVYTADQRKQLISLTRDKLTSACGQDAAEPQEPAAAGTAP